MARDHWILDQESFDKLLAWLDPNRKRAVEKYNNIHRELVRLFLRWGLNTPEELADEIINRITRDKWD